VGAELQWAFLTTAKLREVKLAYAQLQQADLRGADLQGAKELEKAKLHGALRNALTVGPAGFDWPAEVEFEQDPRLPGVEVGA
jgi:hypothetical protein